MAGPDDQGADVDIADAAVCTRCGDDFVDHDGPDGECEVPGCDCDEFALRE